MAEKRHVWVVEADWGAEKEEWEPTASARPTRVRARSILGEVRKKTGTDVRIRKYVRGKK